MNKTGGLFVVSGPSGVGKGTVCAKVAADNPDIFLSISATSRSPREDELEGVHYYFKSPDEFDRMIKAGELLEHACYVSHSYGTPKGPCLEQMEKGNDIILEIEVQGGLKVKEKHPGTVMIFVVPPTMEDLTNRLKSRGTEDEDAVKRRLCRAREEFELIDNYDYIIVNNTVEKAADALTAIIRAEQFKREKILNTIKKELGL